MLTVFLFLFIFYTTDTIAFVISKTQSWWGVLFFSYLDQFLKQVHKIVFYTPSSLNRDKKNCLHPPLDSVCIYHPVSNNKCTAKEVTMSLS